MSKFMGLLGKKMGMTRIFSETGTAIPVTVIEAGPCVVLQKKTLAKEGYNAIQVGFGAKKEQRLNKPEKGHAKAAGKGGFYHIKEFRVADPDAYELGQEISMTEIFNVGELVDVRARSKGRGFQGVVKRHGFKGGRATHGSMFHRRPGAIGCSAWPSRVIKGKKMPGQMGDQFVTKKNCTIVDIRPEQNVLVVKGGVPGAKEGLVQIYKKS
ncbi:50S ribosomal protein L3 [Desulfurivibrio alkaliphilus]|uniref:Large ribosomal subunit protein uL3 n=1 Tax=Desulfurivibrio alkaliphilus (strain DSM 19089 / UNIQEM U267 / AHT2) TaxID=589865 RepID=D6Z3M2_DESAT|nr:50S ribosomal protein L3 [Desulfurivibrio alkaliphilus]ADH86147.1 50S ribosomal protein L3 [Desulfurivibrio alkaliphilus AHT 2]